MNLWRKVKYAVMISCQEFLLFTFVLYRENGACHAYTFMEITHIHPAGVEQNPLLRNMTPF
jgi:hypothetical protein